MGADQGAVSHRVVGHCLFLFDDALYAYYLSRRFGATALEAIGKLHLAVDAAKRATEQQTYFRGAPLTVP